MKNLFLKKSFFMTFIVFLLTILATNQVFAIKIISRAEWWADENMRYVDYPSWQKIFDRRKKQAEKNKNKTSTEAQKKYWSKRKIRLSKMYAHINKYFSLENKIVQYFKTEWWHKLVWPIGKTNFIKAIVVHHTHSEYKNNDSLTWIKSIYRFHTLSRQWWDIGYNYIIGYNWEIFEWRKGWDYVIAAHAKWNNRSTIGISIIWDYDEKWLNPKQLKSLEQLIYHLSKKYWIDFNKKEYFHKTCVAKNCKAPLISTLKYPLVWHRDVGHTSCPWDDLYSQLNTILKRMQIVTKWFKRVYKTGKKNPKIITKTNLSKWMIKKFETLMKKIPEHRLLSFWVWLEKLIDWEYDFEKSLDYEALKEIFIDIEKKKNNNPKTIPPNPLLVKRGDKTWKKSFEENNEIRVKLSYPNKKTVLVAKQAKIFDIKVWENNKLIVDWEEKEILIIDSPKSKLTPYLEIISWDRKPSWDKKNRYNDNKFRWQLIFYVKDGNLEVINKLSLHNYLKWLWEISNWAEKEKIKTIIIAARTYARWYMTKAKKFKGKNLYQASDDPNVFQKYLGYSYEKRSPKVVKVVENTIDKIITYKWKIIKPWYFNQSNWRTKSFTDYCKRAKLVPDCSHPQDFAFLNWVVDPGSTGKTKFLWHWVGISWVWASYLAKKWWTAEMIIKYFLKWVKIEQK